MVKNYGIHDEWKDLDKVNDIDIKSVDGVIDSIKVNGEEAGGGGGGDFSIATVNIIYDITVPEYMSFAGCCAYDNNELYEESPACSYADQGINESSKPSTLKIILYKGLSWLQIYNLGSNVHLEIRGNAEDDNGFVTITGNCTFRFY